MKTQQHLRVVATVTQIEVDHVMAEITCRRFAQATGQVAKLCEE